MGCDHPLTAWGSQEIGSKGKRLITFQRNKALNPCNPMKLPCGQCMGCRLEHARQWAIRCMHEQRLSNASEFVTLTYDNDNLPDNGTLVRRDPQLFMKRLRKEYGNGIRFYGCGEYGARTNRPHYHLLLFNHMFADRKFLRRSADGNDYFVSDSCQRLWPVGASLLADVTFQSCAYVAGYVTDKMSGEKADDWYQGRLPEFSMMSRRPGIGTGWFERFGSHAYEFDSVIVNEREVRPPRFYDKLFDLIDTKRLSEIKRKRRRAALRQKADNTSARRHVKEQVLRLNLKKRDFR